MISNSAVFLCQTILGILTFLLVLRFLMQWTRTLFQNPIGQMTMALTDFMVKPARKLIPSAKKWDIPTLLLALIVQLVQAVLIATLTVGFFSPLLFVWQAVFGVIAQVIDVFFYAILLMAILSWINPYNPVYGMLNQLSAPVLNPLRRWLPAIQGFDLSALVALILLQMVSKIILPSLATALI